ncbi:hypothetical protein [Dyella sp.]|uniref:hypothetical protein n=1 Tax=Dyella sp. TaxID=1869338 RepID=UPI002D7A0D18|nr:hypothetical protein [Dyella sp.]HET6431077.1 hypothetical protein [Dyella sp.]
MTSPDTSIQQRARAAYRQAGRELDPAMARRLAQARRDALAAAVPGPRLTRLLLPAGAFAVLALASLMAWPPRHRSAAPQPVVTTNPTGEDNELPPDADSADPALYQNLDFYGWLAANDRPPPARPKP